jgi:hypothetical protein
MADAVNRDEDGTDSGCEPLGSPDAARYLARLTGMTPEAAKAYAAFHSGRWAQGPAGGHAV